MSDDAKEAKLSYKQKAFIDEYLLDFNATKASIRAGYSEKTAYSIGWENLRKPEIKDEISRRLSERRMSADEVLDRLTDIARGDIADVLDIGSMGFNLDLKKAHDSGKTKLIKKLKQKTTIVIGKGENPDQEFHETEFEMYSAHEALRDLGKVHGLFTDKTRVEDWRTDLLAMLKKGDVSPDDILKSLDPETATALLRDAGVQ